MRNSTRLLLTAIACAPLLALGVACGGDDDDDDSSSFSGYCCLNGAYFGCPSSDAVDQCTSGDTSACTRDPSKDATDCN